MTNLNTVNTVNTVFTNLIAAAATFARVFTIEFRTTTREAYRIFAQAYAANLVALREDIQSANVGTKADLEPNRMGVLNLRGRLQ